MWLRRWSGVRPSACGKSERWKRRGALRRRGEEVWRDVESEVVKRNANDYGRATSLLFDLKTLAEENGTMVALPGPTTWPVLISPFKWERPSGRPQADATLPRQRDG